MQSRAIIASLATTVVLSSGLLFTTAPSASAAAGCVDSDEWALAQPGMTREDVDAVFEATGDENEMTRGGEIDMTSVVYQACNGYAQGEVYFQGPAGARQELYDKAWTQTAPADTPNCVSRVERRAVAGTHMSSTRVHRVFDIRGRYEYRYSYNGRRYVTRSYRVCGQQGDLVRLGMEYVYFRSTGAWHRRSSFAWSTYSD